MWLEPLKSNYTPTQPPLTTPVCRIWTLVVLLILTNVITKPNDNGFSSWEL